MQAESLTIPERLLLAAAGLQRKGGSFSAEDLVVKAWRMYPGYFGLQGYGDEFPDSNRVFTKIMGATSTLRKNGWLERIGTKRYRVTDVGLLKAREVSGRPPVQTRERLATLDRPLVSTLSRLVSSIAAAKYPDLREDISFGDLCALWKISPRSSANQLAVRLAEVEEAIALAAERCGGSPIILPGGGGVLSEVSLRKLADLQGFLKDRFSAELDVIRRRTDERRL